MSLLKIRAALLCLVIAAFAGCTSETAKPGEVDSSEEDTAIAAAEGAADSASRPTVIGAISAGATEMASFGSSQKYLGWYFDATAGQAIQLDAHGVTPASLDTVLILYRATQAGRPSGASLALNDDFGSSVASRITLSAPETRRYVAIVRRFDRGGSGRIALSLMLSGGAGVACGSRGLPACGRNEFCNWQASDQCGRADAPGTCITKSDVCLAVASPACGCDGRTYGNECEAHRAGVSVASAGPCAPPTPTSCSHDSDCPPAPHCVAVPGRACPQYRCNSGTCQLGSSCGGLIGLGCPDGSWCDYADAAMCGAGDQTGFCVRNVSDICPAVEMPVCGCDGNEYGNACVAHVHGTDAAHAGPCATTPPPPPPADCRTTGCHAGSSCQTCWGRFACVPDGALC